MHISVKYRRFAPLLPLLALLGCSGNPSTKAAPEAPGVLPGPIAGTGQTLLSNGWKLNPAGTTTPLGDLPLSLKTSPDGRLAAVVNAGWGENSVQLLDAATGQVLDTEVVPAAWAGLAFAPDGRSLYASGGQHNRIHCFRIEGQKLRPDSAFVLGAKWPKQKIGVAGLAVDGRRNALYAVTREDNSLYTFDLKTRRVLRTLRLPAEAYGALLNPDGSRLYITLWGGHAVAVYDTEKQALLTSIPVESHPNDLALTRDGRRLFVANANSNSVSVIDTRAGLVTETLNTALFPASPAGSTPDGLALSADDSQLFIANADNNCLAVFDVREPRASRPLGFIPTGWYPTAVRVVGQQLLIANGKGSTSKPNPDGPNPVRDDGEKGKGYIGGLLLGSLSRLPVPDEKALAAFSAQVYANTPFTKAREAAPEVPAGSPVPQRVGEASPIRHVFYIIKENRTYDQVLGDLPAGNGDASLCLFPEKVTPNHHALTREFVLLDNFYVDAEVSADGHNWSTAAYATDYVEKNWPVSYSGRGGEYDFEGRRGEVAEPKDGFLWDYCRRAGRSFRSYGEFVYKGKASVPALQGHFCEAYAGFDLHVRDVDREQIWEQDFDRLVAANQLPDLSIIRLPNDHTYGARKGELSPLSYAADNDLALGRLIEHLSKSPVWKESVVMIVEDDAQNGPDHIDAHRSTAYLVGPYIRRHAVVHTAYTTSGMLRTLELILGLPPMSQYDAAALPLWACFTAKPDFKPYTLRPATTPQDVRNTAFNAPARRSLKFDLTREDAAPDLAFNENIWQAIRGEHSRMPAPRRSAAVREAKAEHEEEED
ncbi:bifunctional YncE family protein/alkaline phosphatase family protein [Microvirga sp. STS02]|uniref:bifunctional YncE family protein/alkaline phosphatase family protein n=1 Tax=Hymenobacter negativus TaxID=2795026 RepID=UPI0018DCAC28|nr:MULTISPECIES: bifunctional YncE family protein/alkaline phosphatase family protein [Bacteria]MBH8568758.1 bifunctional YncE family protein/alkaline phosphatase family protein [Hymenobacter negativus]MBR7208492.1 bifunctional YncE family protein/alkaline phosphatase family protein [Microvirga sp. STS02]